MLLLVALIGPVFCAFSETTEKFSIYEGSPPNTVIGTVSLPQGIDFRLSGLPEELSFNLRNGEIRLKSEVDREATPSLSFSLVSRNPPSILHILVEIEDVNDNSPSFPLAFQNVSVLETAPVGTRLPLLTATDPDLGGNGRIERYELKGDGVFALVREEQEVIFLELQEALDREKNQLYSYNLTAIDGGGRVGWTSVYVQVLDVNDCAPEFSSKKIEISWNGQKDTQIVKLNATDEDEDENSKVHFEILDGVRDFEIRGEEIYAKVDSPSCCPSPPCSECLIVVRAVDGGNPPLSSTAEVLIHFHGDNQHDPEIHIKLQPSHVDFAVIDEEDEAGKAVAVLSVTDEDGPFGDSAYLHISNNDEQIFHLDTKLNPALSILRLAKNASDIILKDLLLSFEASDGQSPPRISRRELKVYFGSSATTQRPPAHLTARLAEDAPIGSFVVQIGGGNASGNSFSIPKATGHFEIDSVSGIITTFTPLLGPGRIYFDVSVLPPPPSVLPYLVSVEVTVEDVNDHAPMVLIPDEVEVKEDAMLGEEIVAFGVDDKDVGDNAKVTISVLEGQNCVKVSKNKLILTCRLDYELLKHFDILLEVRDGGKPSLSSKRLLSVVVKDVNDNSPQFPCPESHVAFSPLSPVRTEIGQVEALDLDSEEFGRLSYSLLDPVSEFSVKSENGKVFSAGRLEEKTYKLRFRATDGGGLVSSNNATLFIHVSSLPLPYFSDIPSKIPLEPSVLPGDTIFTLRVNGTSFSSLSELLKVSKEGAISLNSLPSSDRFQGAVLLQQGAISVSKCLQFERKAKAPAPKFTKKKLRLEMNSLTPLGSPLAKATACEEGLFCSYSTDCPSLAIRETGVVLLARILKADVMKCSISAKDLLGREDMVEVEVVKTEEEEEKDTFRLRGRNEFFVDPELPMGTVIGRLPFKRDFVYSTKEKTSVGVFPDGVVYVRRKLKEKDVVAFRVTAKHRRHGNRHSAEVWVRVKEAKNLTPTCHKITNFTIKENNLAGSVAGVIDVPWPFTLHQLDGFKNVHITPLGKILVLHSLDAEVTRSLSFRVEIAVGPKKSICDIYLTVEDENEFSPMFETPFYKAKLPGGTSSGVVGTVKAKDSDRDFKNITHHIISHYRYFKIDKRSGELMVKAKLAGNRFFNVSIVARDNGFPVREGRTFFIVKTMEEEEEEVVFKENSTIRISSSTPVGSIIGRSIATSGSRSLRVSSEDPHFSVDSFGWIRLLTRPASLPKEFSVIFSTNGTSSSSRKIIVSEALKVKENVAPVTIQTVEKGANIVLVDPAGENFQIIGGNLVVVKALDRETAGEYRILLENESKFSLISIEVEDTPDHPPICGSNTFLVGHLPAVVHLSCWDPDTSSSLRFFMKTPNHQGISLKYDGTMTIDRLDGVVTVVPVDITDRSSKPISVSVILIRDVPDETISFPAPSFNLLLSSSLENGQSFGRVAAEAGSRVDYHIIGSDSIGVNRETGELLVGNRSEIIRNPAPRDVILVAASRLGIATVQIRVEIVEDSLFLPKSTFLLTPQKLGPGVSAGIIDIGRNDVIVENSDDRFILQGRELLFKGLFEEKKGKLISTELEAKKGRISAKIKVHILLPESENELVFTIPENYPRGTIVGAVPDGEFFEITDGTPLKLDSDGFLRTTVVLDREKTPEFNFTLGKSVARLVVEDENDNSPVLERKSINIEVPEDLEVGSALTRIRWSDSDANNIFVLKIVEGNEYLQFFIDSKGLLLLEAPLDREKKKEHRLKVVLSDGTPPFPYHSVDCEVLITVLDVNDNAPSIVSPQSFTVEENTPRGTTIGAILASDPDSGSLLTYRILPESLPYAEFTIDPIFGYLQVNDVIDYELRRNYTFFVEASDGKLSTAKEITVIVIDKNDEQPKFKEGQEVFNVKETTPVGHSITQFLIEDADGADNKECEFWLESSSQNVFKVSPRSGILYVTGKLDFEQVKVYNLTVNAKNLAGGETAKKNLIIKIEDENDEAPRFLLGSPQTIEVFENIPGPFPMILGSSVSEDDDVTDVVAYSLLSGNTSLFGVDSRTGDVLLLRSLDREEQEKHLLTVLATDSGRPRMTSSAEITILVLDDNDNSPEFEQPYFVAKIIENFPLGTVVTVLKSVDLDEGENSEISYSILETNVPFSIDKINGTITVTGEIDREEKAEWEFQVEAIDNGRFERRSTKTTVTVKIEDQNDSAPLIRNRQMDVFIDGKLARGEVVHVVDAWDADGDVISLTLSGPDAKFFEILKDGRILSRAESLFSKSFYSLTVSADDNRGKNSISTFTFYVDDAIFPRFKKMPQTTVPENSLDVVGVFNATSAKSAPRNQIQYSILAGNDGSFEIGALNGVLRIINPLDRERQDFHRIWVMATDGDLPPKSSIQDIEIRVADQNDNKPSFGQVVYRVSIKENDEPQELLNISASDEDIGRNAVISFSISEGNEASLFSIDSRGTIRTTGPLDREAVSLHRLVIIATDGGTTPLSNQAVVLVEVEDEDDNSPRFTRLFHAEIEEDLPVGSEVVLVSATDADSHGKHSFQLEDGDGTFVIEEETGMIKLGKELDREKTSSYRLRARLEDGVWTIFTSVQVTILDVNDNFPVFEQDSYIFTVSGTATIGSVMAKDADEGENGKVLYYLLEDSPNIAIDAETGALRATGSGAKDLEKLTIIARDSGIPSRSSSTTVWILFNCSTPPPLTLYLPKNGSEGGVIAKIANVTVISSPFFNISEDKILLKSLPKGKEGPAGSLVLQRASDFVLQPLEFKIVDKIAAPRFSTRIFHFTLLESTPIGTEFGTIAGDSHGWKWYSCSSRSSSPIEVTNNGKLILKEELDYEEAKRFVFNVTVEDLQGRNDSTQVVLDVLDVNDMAPFFEIAPFWTRILTSANETICFPAVDEDTVPHNILEYDSNTSSAATVDDEGCLNFSNGTQEEIVITAKNGPFQVETRGRIVDWTRTILPDTKREVTSLLVTVNSSTPLGSELLKLENGCSSNSTALPKGICLDGTSVSRCGDTVEAGTFTVSCANSSIFDVSVALAAEERESSFVARVRESRFPQKIIRLPMKENRRFYVDDQQLKKIFSVSEDGVLSGMSGLDREEQAWYRIPIKTSDRRRLIVRAHVDDVVDSALPTEKDISIFVVGPIHKETKTPVHPASFDSISIFQCQPVKTAMAKITSNCLLSLKNSSSFSLSTKGILPGTSFPFNVRISSLTPPEAIKSPLVLEVFAPESGIAEFLSGIQESFPDLKFLPLGIFSKLQNFFSLVIAATDRNQKAVSKEELRSVIDSFLSKRPLLEILPSKPSSCQKRSTMEIIGSGHQFSFRGTKSVWIIPEVKIDTRCGEKTLKACPSQCRSVDGKCECPKQEKKSCSCPDGDCVEDEGETRCERRETKNTCEDPSAVSLFDGHLELRPTTNFQSLLPIGPDCNDIWISLDFRTDSDGVLLTFDYSDGLKTTVEILHGKPIFKISDGYRSPLEIPLTDDVTDGKWHNLILRMTENGRKMAVEVDGVGREAKSRVPLPSLLSSSLKMIFLGSDGHKKGFPGCIRGFIVNEHHQNLHSDEAKPQETLFVASAVGRVSWGSEEQKTSLWRSSAAMVTLAVVVAMAVVLVLLFCATKLYFRWRNEKGPAWQETRDINAIPVRHLAPKSSTYSSTESHIYDVADRNLQYERAPTLPASRIRTVADFPLSIQRLSEHSYYRNEAFTPPLSSDDLV